MERLTVCIFSYNRGGYLRNCAESVLRHMAGAVLRIHDDGSDDPETRAVLDQYAAHLAPARGQRNSKHGGLYGNMQAALDDCRTPWVLFLQDDMQVVRPVDAEDMEAIARIFAQDEGRAFLYPFFMKATSVPRYRTLMALLPGLPAYGARRDADPADRIAYADVCIAHTGRLRARAWAFRNRERDNAAQARGMFSDMPFLSRPFAFFCPEVPVFRNRAQTLAARIAARITGTDVKALRDMAVGDVARLMARDPAEWPVAEDWLMPVNPSVRRPFVYQDVRVRGWLNVLHRLELALRKR